MTLKTKCQGDGRGTTCTCPLTSLTLAAQGRTRCYVCTHKAGSHPCFLDHADITKDCTLNGATHSEVVA